MSSVEPNLPLPKALDVPTWLSTFEPGKPLAVAFSGGADSTALLWACQLKWPGQVHAVHVHHGLQSAADDFVQHCKGFCDLHHIPIEVVYVNAKHRPGQSPEDAARRARYQALEDVLLTKSKTLLSHNTQMIRWRPWFWPCPVALVCRACPA
jgi:tRNA(Ile)-lysidine synthase TilS/MesJ